MQNSFLGYIRIFSVVAVGSFFSDAMGADQALTPKEEAALRAALYSQVSELDGPAESTPVSAESGESSLPEQTVENADSDPIPASQITLEEAVRQRIDSMK